MSNPLASGDTFVQWNLIPCRVLIITADTEDATQLCQWTIDRGHKMNDNESFSTSMYQDQTHLAERELASFIRSVTELFGPEQARASTEDWLDEAESMDTPPRSTARDWRAVTIASSARLASQIDAARYRQ
jgi:hypothetical protein